MRAETDRNTARKTGDPPEGVGGDRRVECTQTGWVRVRDKLYQTITWWLSAISL